MIKIKFLILSIFFVIFATNVDANQAKFGSGTQEHSSAIAQQLELARHFFSSGKFPSKEEKINKMLQKLDLSAKQSRQIDEIKQKFKTERDTLKQQVENHRQEIRILLATDTSSEQLRRDYQETQSLLKRLGNNRLEMMMQIRATLTPEQRSQLWKSMQQNRN